MTRYVYFALGSLFTGLGFVGAFLPLLPTVPFLLLAVWCYARSSQRLHDWLYHHPTYGPPIRAWDTHRAIPPRAKIASCTMMTLSMAIMLWVTDLSPWAYAGIAAVLLTVGVWIATRPGVIPAEAGFPETENRP